MMKIFNIVIFRDKGKKPRTVTCPRCGETFRVKDKVLEKTKNIVRKGLSELKKEKQRS
jgi:hypothetical protein